MSNEELSRDEKLVRSVQEKYHNMLEQGVDPYEWAYAWRSEINRGGFKAVDFLMREIVDTGKCVGCAACVTICPTDVFDYKDERPVDTRNDACVAKPAISAPPRSPASAIAVKSTCAVRSDSPGQRNGSV